MEQRQLAWLITTRSQVRVLVPQPKKNDHSNVVVFLFNITSDTRVLFGGLFI